MGAAALVLAGCSGGGGTPAASPSFSTPVAAPAAAERAPDSALAPAAPSATARGVAAPAPPPGGAHAPPTVGAASPGAPPTGARPARTTAPRVEGEARVLRVVEVALLDVLVAGDVYRVRLAGVGLPPVFGVIGCYGEEARGVTEGLAPVGGTIVLEAAPGEGDALPAVYAWAAGELLNARVVEEGYSLVGEQGARGSHAAALLAAERSAARSIAGLWGAAVGIDAHRGALRCESLSGYFSASHVGLTGDLADGVPYGRTP